ncbi:MAG TPA: hypothetical protein VFE86_09520 [Ilumatobacteraceae bacterium]|nr:hypothetical protein [Ilumatobacteraceae bacterium]
MLASIAIVAAALATHGVGVSADAASAQPTRTVVVHTTGSVAGQSFGAVVDAFAFHSPTVSGTNATVDATVGTAMECQTDKADVVIRTKGLAEVTLTGHVSGTCFDFDTSQSTSWNATLHLNWRGTGGVRVESFNDGVCTTRFEQRPAIERGSLVWTIPSTGQSGTATPIYNSTLERDTTRCAATSS